MNIKTIFFSALSISYLLISQSANADFRKALDAYIARDGETMLKEVKDAVNKGNADGSILFLGILKEYPKTWRSILDEGKQSELFNYLDAASSQSGLQAQYKLAVIPRRESNSNPIPASTNNARESWYEARKQEKLKEYREEVARVEPVANKGYAPAALNLYGNYAHNLTKSKEDHDKAIHWLKKSAQLGDVQAAYILGMKYLHVIDQIYGCTANSKNMSLNCQLPLDEAKGWHWMQVAAKHANEPGMMVLPLDELPLNMGDLYMRGVGEDKPDYEQAYLWYLKMPLGLTTDTSQVWAKLEALKNIGQLTRLNPSLDKAWGNSTTWQQAVQSQEVRDALKNSTNKLPKLIQKKTINNKPQPVFSMSTVRWFRPNLSYGGIVLDIYEDGRVNLLFGDAALNESNDEVLMRIEPYQVRKFIEEFQNLNFSENYPSRYCESGCLESLESLIFVKDRLIKLKNTSLDGDSGISNPNMKQVLEVVEKYVPLLKLTCDSDVGDGKLSCYQIYKEILTANNRRQ